MSYNGSDLSSEYKSFFRRERNKITKVLESLGCTEIKLDYGFYFFSGFFTSKTGQIYYLSGGDNRSCKSDYQLLVRTAKSYKDYSGGSNNFVHIDRLSSFRFQ